MRRRLLRRCARGRRLRRRRWRRQLLSLLGRWRRQLLSTARVQVRWSLHCATNHQPLHGSGCARRMASFETGASTLCRQCLECYRRLPHPRLSFRW